jgi:hypothetical protein
MTRKSKFLKRHVTLEYVIRPDVERRSNALFALEKDGRSERHLVKQIVIVERAQN